MDLYSIVDGYICYNDTQDIRVSALTSFALGVIFAPWSRGYIWLILFYLLYWIFDYEYSSRRSACWHLPQRIISLGMSLIGFLIGRLVFCNSVLVRGVLPFDRTN